MRLPSKMAMHLFEAAEEIGVRREELVTPLGLDAARLTAPRGELDWDTLVALLDQLSRRVGGDVDQMRAVGRKMVNAPSFFFLREVARTVISLQSLYLAGERWIAPAAVPHLILRSEFPSDDRMHFRCSIPELYAPSAPYLHIFEGLLVEVPSMLGLAPAAIVTTTVTPRELDIVLDLPPSRSVFGRARRSLRALIHPRHAPDLLEQQRRELQEGLDSAERSTRELQALLERLPLLVMIHREGKLLWVNGTVLRTLGYDQLEDVVGTSFADHIPAAWRPMLQKRMNLDPSSATMPELENGALLTRSGGTILVEVSPTQLVTYRGQPARLVVGRDGTERMRLREQVVTTERLASVGMLAAGVAHEVNNPLAYVLNNIEMARRDVALLGDATRTSREALGTALAGVDRIRTVVRDLLALSRVDDDAIGLIDAAAVIESTLLLAAQKIAERADLERDYRDVPLVRGTAARLGQLLLALIANALEAMPLATRATNRLRIALISSPSRGAVVEVTDNGAGSRSASASPARSAHRCRSNRPRDAARRSASRSPPRRPRESAVSPSEAHAERVARLASARAR
jgi:PAS domain S-box-containing protein